MKTIRAGLLIVLLAIVTIPVSAFAFLWMEAGAVIADYEGSSVRSMQAADAPLTVAENTIAIAEFGQTWNVRGVPCRTISSLWSEAARGRSGALSGRAVSAALSSTILLSAAPERSLEWHLKNVLVACRLEQRYSDKQLLRGWLANAYFGERPFGIERAAHSLFGKAAAELNAAESARIAALLRSPRLRRDSEAWDKRARLISERVARAQRN